MCCHQWEQSAAQIGTKRHLYPAHSLAALPFAARRCTSTPRSSRAGRGARPATPRPPHMLCTSCPTSQRPSSVALPTFVRGDARLLPGCQSLAPWTARCWCCPSFGLHLHLLCGRSGAHGQCNTSKRRGVETVFTPCSQHCDQPLLRNRVGSEHGQQVQLVSERVATSEGAPAMGKRPNMETSEYRCNK